MSNTYCGKNCDECKYRTEIDCKGCKDGPGRVFEGNCNIAKCCRYKECASCSSCVSKNTCSIINEKNSKPLQWKEIAECEHLETEANKITAKKCYPIFEALFWLFLAGYLISLLSGFSLIISAVSICCMIGYYILLLKLSSENDHYLAAGICGLIYEGGDLLELILFKGEDAPTAYIFVSLPCLIFGVVAIYKECKAHSELMAGFDPDLSEKWLKLWKYLVIFTITAFSSVLFVGIPILLYTVMIGSLIAVLVVSILKFVYLKKSATAFKRNIEFKV